MTTETKQISLVDKFNTQIKENKTTYYIEKELEGLLNSEVAGRWFSEENKALLTEYRANFDWEVSYWVKFDWEVGSDFSSSEKAENLAEFNAYLSGKKEPPTTEDLEKENEYWRDDIETEVYGVTSVRPSISVSNLRLKKKNKQNYSVSFSVDTPPLKVEDLPDYEGASQSTIDLSNAIELIVRDALCGRGYDLKSIQVVKEDN